METLFVPPYSLSCTYSPTLAYNGVSFSVGLGDGVGVGVGIGDGVGVGVGVGDGVGLGVGVAICVGLGFAAIDWLGTAGPVAVSSGNGLGVCGALASFPHPASVTVSARAKTAAQSFFFTMRFLLRLYAHRPRSVTAAM